MVPSRVVLGGAGMCGGVWVPVKNEKMAEIFFSKKRIFKISSKHIPIVSEIESLKYVSGFININPLSCKLMAFNNYNNHPSTAKLQAAATLCAHSKNRLGRGEVVDGAEITFLQCSLEGAQAQPLQGLWAALPRGEEVSQGGQSKACC